MKEFEFIAKNSGDGESFCFEVDKETYIKITGEVPDAFDYVIHDFVDTEEGIQCIPDLTSPLRIYPNQIFGDHYGKIKVKLTVEGIS